MSSSAAAKPAVEVAPGSPIAGRIRSSLQQILALVSLIVLVIFFSITGQVSFYQASNLSDILLSAVVTGLLAVGTTFVIVTGGIDLSIGTGMILSGVITGLLLVNVGLPLPLGVLGGIAAGALMGAINGTIVAYLRIPPFIATLAMMLVASGLALVISGTKPIYTNDVVGFQGFLALNKPIPGVVVPNAVFILFGAAMIAGVILAKTTLGRYTYAIGSNEQATALSGINTAWWKLKIYTLAGAFTGLAGVVATARFNTAQPSGGEGLELQAIAAVVIGGTSLSGGKGTIFGTIVGALIMAVLTNGLQIINVHKEWQDIVIGLVILGAVFIDLVRRRQQQKRT